MPDTLITKADPGLPGLDDPVRRKMGIIAFPGGIGEINPVAVPTDPDGLARVGIHYHRPLGIGSQPHVFASFIGAVAP